MAGLAARSLETKALGAWVAKFGEVAVTRQPLVMRQVAEAMPKEANDLDSYMLARAVNMELLALCARADPGDLEKAKRLRDDVQPLVRQNPVMALWIATAYVKRGRLEDALAALEIAATPGSGVDWANVAIDPDFAPLRAHPGFARLIGE